MRHPNLFMVGPPKCGTTALYELLRQHPDIFMCPEKEPHHFLASSNRGGIVKFPSTYQDEDAYLNLFRDAKQEKVVGEASVWYLTFDGVARKLKQFSPDAKVIAVMREPVDWLTSFYYFHSKGRVPYPEFEKRYFAGEGGGPQGKFLYAPHIEEYHRRFGQNFRVVLFEEFRKDNIATMEKLYRFLGVDPEFRPRVRKVNVGGVPRNRAFSVLLDIVYLPPRLAGQLGINDFMKKTLGHHRVLALKEFYVGSADRLRGVFLERKGKVQMGKKLEERLSDDWEKALKYCEEQNILL